MYNHLLDTFLCVADTGSFAKASEELYISSTAVMNQINALERQLQVKLLKRTPRGVTLTEAGKSVCRDARLIIRLSDEAVKRARALASRETYTVRVGTSMLNPCKPLLALWNRISGNYPQYKIQIIPYEDHYNSNDLIIRSLGSRFDFMVAPCDSARWLNQSSFLQMGNLPLCCGVPYSHRLSGKTRLEIRDLFGERLMMVREGDSAAVDQLRANLRQHFPEIQLVDTDFYYDMDVFNRCEQEGNILITLEMWAEVHPLLATIPVNWDYKLPYGLLYEEDPPGGIRQFVEIIREAVRELAGSNSG